MIDHKLFAELNKRIEDGTLKDKPFTDEQITTLCHTAMGDAGTPDGAVAIGTVIYNLPLTTRHADLIIEYNDPHANVLALSRIPLTPEQIETHLASENFLIRMVAYNSQFCTDEQRVRHDLTRKENG